MPTICPRCLPDRLNSSSHDAQPAKLNSCLHKPFFFWTAKENSLQLQRSNDSKLKSRDANLLLGWWWWWWAEHHQWLGMMCAEKIQPHIVGFFSIMHGGAGRESLVLPCHPEIRFHFIKSNKSKKNTCAFNGSPAVLLFNQESSPAFITTGIPRSFREAWKIPTSAPPISSPLPSKQSKWDNSPGP